ncbi:MULTISPECIES: hypothetical protein [unclassified Haematobacter]|uniref:hypothetical protein n=1 Tax=unclassified Haematobacter TaxID=2640585 RepID=UPI0025C59423|nr:MULTISPECIES: hypothetical protein [unclassified Haematobacter]
MTIQNTTDVFSPDTEEDVFDPILEEFRRLRGSIIANLTMVADYVPRALFPVEGGQITPAHLETEVAEIRTFLASVEEVRFLLDLTDEALRLLTPIFPILIAATKEGVVLMPEVLKGVSGVAGDVTEVRRLIRLLRAPRVADKEESAQ